MVERVNKPETPPAYQILPAKETKDDQSKRQQYEEGEEHYQKSSASGNWDKFRGRAMTIKPVRTRRDRIEKLLFKNTVLRSGIGILEATVVWKDGRTTDPALFLIPRTEEYMRLRLLKRGQVVPENFWAKGEEIEMGIMQLEPSSAPFTEKEVERESKGKEKGPPWLARIGLADATGRLQWFNLAMYLLGLAAIILAVIFAIR